MSKTIFWNLPGYDVGVKYHLFSWWTAATVYILGGWLTLSVKSNPHISLGCCLLLGDIGATRGSVAVCGLKVSLVELTDWTIGYKDKEQIRVISTSNLLDVWVKQKNIWVMWHHLPPQCCQRTIRWKEASIIVQRAATQARHTPHKSQIWTHSDIFGEKHIWTVQTDLKMTTRRNRQ